MALLVFLLRKHRGGEKEDAQRLSEILVASEGRMQSETLAQQAAATERLEKMKGSAMKPELQTWLMRRLNVLTKMTKEL